MRAIEYLHLDPLHSHLLDYTPGMWEDLAYQQRTFLVTDRRKPLDKATGHRQQATVRPPQHTAIWYADVPNKHCVRVREGGEVLLTIDLDRGCFACALGGADKRTLFIIANE